MLSRVTHSRPAMGTLFEVRLLGDDPAHLHAVANAALDEVTRLDHSLSRHDPTSEVSRLNRDARHRPALASHELLAILETGLLARDDTQGAFSLGEFALDPTARTVQIHRPLDLGGFAKGYALDRAREILRHHNISHAFLHGGTSSLLALGDDLPLEGWSFPLRDPFHADAPPILNVHLRDQSASCSSVFHPDHARSDILDPTRNTPLTAPSACLVLAETAAEAEILSTALLVMGSVRASRFPLGTARAAWIEPGPSLTWLGADPP